MIPFINVMIGTRGQFVKTAPLLIELDKRNVAYRLINTGQHTASTREMAEVFGVRHGDVFLTRRTSDITSATGALLWCLVCCVKGLLRGKRNSSCSTNALMIHGDTLSSLIGCLLSLAWGQRLVHVESGLTTGALLNPFPEEIIRRICVARARVLYAPNEWAAAQCLRRNARGEIICSGANTVLDSLRHVACSVRTKDPPGSYGVVTLHRNETFYSRTRAAAAIDAVSGIGHPWKILFVMHKFTECRLKKYGLFARIMRNGTVTVLGYKRYDDFMRLISRASFVITDGGGLQEETYYLNVPCLVLRKKTERPEGLDGSAMLSAGDGNAVTAFIDGLAARTHTRDFSALHPSKTIIDHLVTAFPGKRATHET